MQPAADNGNRTRPVWSHVALRRLFPLIGSLAFLLLYVAAAFRYPGGNYLDKNEPGFSWSQNYWCNLLAGKAINGQPNAAQPFAFTAMAVAGLTLVNFWYSFSGLGIFDSGEQRVMRASGLLAMGIGLFIFTPFHDAVINGAGLFGLIALGGTLVGLRRLRWTGLFYAGWLVLALIGLNNLLYYGNDPLHWLALVQKITFVVFLAWISSINLRWCRNAASSP